MSNLQAFFAQNVEKVEVEGHVISKRFKQPVLDDKGNPKCDEKGNVITEPIKWKFGALDGDQDEAIRKANTKRKPVPGKKHLLLPETDYDTYTLQVAIATCKFPDLNNAELQASYGVMGAEALVKKMLTAGEIAEFKQVAQSVNGFDIEMDDLVEEAKN